MNVTHQSIAERLEQLCDLQQAAEAAARAPMERERKSLEELCAGLGHVFRRPVPYCSYRVCGVCGTAAP